MKTISRDTIINAIKTEPLKRGRWAHFEADEDYAKNCKVCAVGAVFRSMAPANMLATDLDDICSDLVFMSNHPASGAGLPKEYIDQMVTAALSDGAYLNALSLKYEYLAARFGSGQRTRKALVKWVRETFPKRVKLLFEVKL